MRKTTAFNPHDERPSFLKIKSRCNGDCADEAECSETPAPLDKKGVGGITNIEEPCPGEHVSEPLLDDKDAEPFYTVSPMNGVLSPDEARYNLEDSLDR